MVREGPGALNDFAGNDQDIGATLRLATGQLTGISDSPRLDAELLLARALDVSRSYLVAHPDDRPDGDARRRFAQAMAERARGVPIAYIVGEKEFWSATFMVTPATLVPRPDTELLVEKALRLMPREDEVCVADLGTGSGAVALSIARERPLAHIVATDLSAEALAIAGHNARQLDVANVEFLLGRWTEPLAGQQFDLLVSNPPYICSGDPALDKLVHEPRAALVAGEDGLDDIRLLAAECGSILRPGGHLLLEHGAGQRDDVARLLLDAGWSDVQCHADLAGRPRVTQAAFLA